MRKETSEEELLSPQKLQLKIKALRWNTLFLNISCIFLAIGGIKLRNDLTELQGAIRLALENTKTILEQVNIICGQINAIFQMVDGVIPL